jgi:hypothetical protein
MSEVCPSKLKITYLPTKEESKERKVAMVVVKNGTLWKIV